MDAQLQYMAQLLGQASVGSQPAHSYKELCIGMAVIDASERPYRETVIYKLASRYKEGEPEYALVGRASWTEWVDTHYLVPIEKGELK